MSVLVTQSMEAIIEPVPPPVEVQEDPVAVVIGDKITMESE